MRKRRRTEPDPLDPQSYAPDPERLWHCVRQASGNAGIPSLRFLATLAWENNTRFRMPGYTWRECPPRLPVALWNEVTWVLGSRSLALPTGARTRCSCSGPLRHSEPYDLYWTVEFPEAMGGELKQACWTYTILPTRLYLTDYHCVARPLKSFSYEHGVLPLDLSGSPEPALAIARRKRWLAPQPIQIPLKEQAPAMAQGLLTHLWKLRTRCPEMRGEKNLWIPDGPDDPDGLAYQEAFDEFLNALMWLFLKGFVDVARLRKLNVGVVYTYRNTKGKRVAVDSIDTMPEGKRKRLVSVFRDWGPVVAVTARFGRGLTPAKYWCPKGCSGQPRECHGSHRHTRRQAVRQGFGDRFHPLVLDAIMHVISCAK